MTITSKILLKKIDDFLDEGSRKKMAQTKCNATMLDLVKKDLPKIESPTPQDFWATMTHLFNQGRTPVEAAKRAVELYK